MAAGGCLCLVVPIRLGDRVAALSQIMDLLMLARDILEASLCDTFTGKSLVLTACYFQRFASLKIRRWNCLGLRFTAYLALAKEPIGCRV